LPFRRKKRWKKKLEIRGVNWRLKDWEQRIRWEGWKTLTKKLGAGRTAREVRIRGTYVGGMARGKSDERMHEKTERPVVESRNFPGAAKEKALSGRRGGG